MMAGLLFASCDKTNDPNNNVGSGELETSYIAVNVKSTNSMTRAEGDPTDGGFVDGVAGENEVNSVTFFFFKENGEPFPLTAPNGNAGATPGIGVNYWTKNSPTSSSEGDNNNSIETLVAATIVFEKAAGEFPRQMVAVVNWKPATEQSYTLEQLRTEMITEAVATGTGNFVMSNSVYSDGEKVIDATAITIDNIASTSGDAIQTPVEVYVERLAAKVTVKQGNDKHATGINVNTTPIYAQIKAWDLNTTANESQMLKKITYNATYFEGWNDILNHRSYWAEPITYNYTKAFTPGNFANSVNGSTYCLENTTASDADTDENTKLVVHAEFVDANGTPIKVAQLFSEYMTIDGLRNTIANSVAEYYYGDENSKTRIEPQHIEFVAVDNSYLVKYKLTEVAKQLNWYVKNGTEYTVAQATDIETALGKLQPAKLWNEGGYYYIPIKHLGGLYGIVRNHSYVITIDGIKGLGTPIYEADTEISVPVTPTDDETYIAASINVLAWKIVNQNVTLQ